MKIFIMTDLEGVAGVSTFDVDTSQSGRYYEKAKSLLTAEVNAAVDACVAAGASEILVADGHGAGAINIEELHEDAKLLHGGSRMMPFGMDRGFDAMLMIGQHAMQGAANANLHHTMDHNRVIEYRLNDAVVGEIALYAYLAGHLGMPLIYLSGDSAACDEAKAISHGIVTSAVKEGLSQNAVISLSPVKARNMIRADVQKALASNGNKDPLTVKTPVTLSMRFMSSDIVGRYMMKNGVRQIDTLTVSYTAENVYESFKIWY